MEPRKVTTTGRVRDFIDELLLEAKLSSKNYLILVSKNVHEKFGFKENKMPIVCNAMWQKLKQYGGGILHTTPSHQSTTIEIKYNLDKVVITHGYKK
jgi:hypothetical protein